MREPVQTADNTRSLSVNDHVPSAKGRKLVLALTNFYSIMSLRLLHEITEYKRAQHELLTRIETERE